ncbi:MAG: PEP-CTERM sorting domain-containing protein [Fimbriimonadaceae bacterium]|nr:PEP-CTERM sorting domain-containing protein [Fimbriimonadaceae bacterium]
MKRTLAGAALFAAVFQAHAGITALGGPTTLITAPASMKYTANAYNTATVNYWVERENHLLANDLVISMLPPVSFPTNVTSHFNNNDNKIVAGTAIDSYYLYFDPSSGDAVARFQTDRTILGLITNERNNAANDHFMLSDYLINPLVPSGNIPASHFEARGMEIGANEYVRWLAPNQIEVHLSATNPGDQIRIITAAVPEPATLAALGLGALSLLRRRRTG